MGLQKIRTNTQKRQIMNDRLQTLFLWFFKTGFLCSFEACPRTGFCRPDWPQTHRDLPASTSQVLRLEAYTTVTQPDCRLLMTYKDCYLQLTSWITSDLIIHLNKTLDGEKDLKHPRGLTAKAEKELT